VNIALQVFTNIVDRRDELRDRLALTPSEWSELGELEELVTALAGSGDAHTVARHAAELAAGIRLLQ
jgi:hypothetical protein